MTSSRATVVVHSVPLPSSVLVRALARLIPPPRGRDSSPELPHGPKHYFCRSLVLGPVLVAGVLQVSSSSPSRQSRPTPATLDSRRSRLPCLQRPLRRGQEAAPITTLLTTCARSQPSVPDATIPIAGYRFARTLCPCARPVSGLRPLALGPISQPAFPPQSLTSLARISALVRARSCLDLILAVDL